ncbi:MAG: FAD-dependent monooxygenase [Chitinophagales bacterium]
MKTSVIGGGIAGLTTGICLHRKGFDTQVFEKSQRYDKTGLGFLLLPNGLQILDLLGLGNLARERGQMIQKGIFRNPKGTIQKEVSLEGHLGISRFDLMDLLQAQLSNKVLKTNKAFSHFSGIAHQTIHQAHFMNGESEEADIFIGADGIHSRVRKALWGCKGREKARLKELVGMCDAPDIAAELNGIFLKTQHESYGLSAGIVPAGQGKIIWFMQYDSHKWDVVSKKAEDRLAFVKKLIGKWANPIPQLIARTDFDKVYQWHNKDKELPEKFNHKNVMLIGDACHPFMTFTSQGVNSALDDAWTLSNLLEAFRFEENTYTKAFTAFELQRRSILERYKNTGRLLAQAFLHPQQYASFDQLPLVK